MALPPNLLGGHLPRSTAAVKPRLVAPNPTSALFDGYTAGLDRRRPPLDFAFEERGQIFRRPLRWLGNFKPELLQPLANPGRIKRLGHRRVEAAHYRLGGSLRQEQRVPAQDLEILQPLLFRRRNVWQDFGAFAGKQRERLGCVA